MGTGSDLVNVSEAAEILGISEQQVRYHARKGRLRRAVPVESVWLFKREDVVRLNDRLKGLEPSEVAELLGVQRGTVVKWVKAGKLEGRRVGGRWRCTPQGVRAVAEDRGVIIPEGVLGGDTPKVL